MFHLIKDNFHLSANYNDTIQSGKKLNETEAGLYSADK